MYLNSIQVKYILIILLYISKILTFILMLSHIYLSECISVWNNSASFIFNTTIK